MASRLAEIYRSEKKTGGGLGSAVSKRLAEKIDPRKMLDQSGLLVSMFPSLKAYNPTKKAEAATAAGKQAGIDKREEMQTDVLREILQATTLVSRNSSITAKNSLVLPAMARDMNLMRQNIAKLVKLQGGVATNKADMFFKRAGERESMYESSLSKLFKKDKAGSVSKIGASTTGGGLGLDPSQMIASMAAGSMMGSIASMVSSLLMNPIVLGVLGGSLLIYLAKRFAEEDLKKPENKDAPINQVRRGEAKTLGEAGEKNRQKALGKLTTQGTANEIVKRLIEDKLTGAAAESFVKEIARESNLQEVLKICDPKLKEDYLKMVASLQPPTPQQPAPSTPPPPLPATGAGGGRGFVNPTLASPSPSAVPANAIMSGSGVPLTSGSGEYVTSGQTPSPVESTTGTQAGTMDAYKARRQATSPSPVSSAPSSSSYIKTASEMIVKEEGLPKGGKAYYDPPGQKNLVSIGYGHQIKDYEYKSGFIQAGNESIPILGERGIDTVLSKEQSKKLLEMDLPKYEKAAAGPLGEAWSKLNDEQKASLISYAYNTGSTTSLVKKGLKEAILKGDFQEAGKIISEKGIRTAGGVENKTLVARRKHEGVMFASTSTPSVTPSTPSTGVQVASASTAVADGRRESMAQPTGGTAVVGSQPPRQTLASSQRKPGSAYDTDLISTLIGRQSATA